MLKQALSLLSLSLFLLSAAPGEAAKTQVAAGGTGCGVVSQADLSLSRYMKEGTICTCTDCSADCDTGGGTNNLLCHYDGSNWINITSSVGASYDITAYGAVCDGTTDDAPAIRSAIAAASAAGGGQILIPASADDCVVYGQIELEDRVSMRWLGSNSLRLRSDSESYTGFRWGLLMAVPDGQVHDIHLINPRIDCGGSDVLGANGIAFSRDTHRLTVTGGVVKNCWAGTNDPGGKCLSVQRGVQNAVFQGVNLESCYIAMGIDGVGNREDGEPFASTGTGTSQHASWPDWVGEHADEIVYSGITVDGCGFVFASITYGTNQLDHEDSHGILQGVTARNCGDPTTYWSGAGAAVDGGLIGIMGGSSITINGLSVANKTSATSGTCTSLVCTAGAIGEPCSISSDCDTVAYPEIGAIVRGRGKSIRVSNVYFAGDVVNVMDFAAPDNDVLHDAMSGSVDARDMVIDGVRVNGTLSGSVIASPGKVCEYGTTPPANTACVDASDCDTGAGSPCAEHNLTRPVVRGVEIENEVTAIVDSDTADEIDCYVQATLHDSANSPVIQTREGRCNDVADHINDFSDGSSRGLLVENSGTLINGIAFIHGSSPTIKAEEGEGNLTISAGSGNNVVVDRTLDVNAALDLLGDLTFADAAGASPKAIWNSFNAAYFELYASNDDIFRMESTDTSNTTIRMENLDGAGVMDLFVEGAISGSNLSGTNTGDNAAGVDPGHTHTAATAPGAGGDEVNDVEVDGANNIENHEVVIGTNTHTAKYEPLDICVAATGGFFHYNTTGQDFSCDALSLDQLENKITAVTTIYTDTNVVPIEDGGTGAITAAAARTALELDPGLPGDVWVEKGGDVMTSTLTMQANVVLDFPAGAASPKLILTPNAGASFDIFAENDDTLEIDTNDLDDTIVLLENDDATGVMHLEVEGELRNYGPEPVLILQDTDDTQGGNGVDEFRIFDDANVWTLAADGSSIEYVLDYDGISPGGYTFSKSELIPSADASASMGSALFSWNNAFFDGTVTAANITWTAGADCANVATGTGGVLECGASPSAPVDSVNSQTGIVVLDADDISDATTANRFTTSGDISKLAGIEALADVTDATNVASAGALMLTGGTMSGTLTTVAMTNTGAVTVQSGVTMDDNSGGSPKTIYRAANNIDFDVFAENDSTLEIDTNTASDTFVRLENDNGGNGLIAGNVMDLVVEGTVTGEGFFTHVGGDVGKDSKCAVIESPASSEVFYNVWRAPYAVTVTEVWCDVQGTGSIAMDWVNTGSDVDTVPLSCVAASDSDSSLDNDPTIADGGVMSIKFGTKVGTVTQVSVCFEYTID